MSNWLPPDVSKLTEPWFTEEQIEEFKRIIFEDKFFASSKEKEDIITPVKKKERDEKWGDW